MALLYQQESNELMRLALQLHQELGCGFKEKVYQDAFEVLLKEEFIDKRMNNSLILKFLIKRKKEICH